MSNGSSGGANSPPTEVAIAVEFVKVVRPVIDAANGGPREFGRLLDDMGVSDQVVDRDAEKLFGTVEKDVVGNGEDIVKSITSIVNGVSSATDIDGLGDLDEVDWTAVAEAVDVQDFVKIGKSAVRIYKTVKALSDVDIEDPDIDDLADAVLDYLIINYLKTYQGDVHALFRVTGVIEKKGPGKPAEFKPGEIGDAITDPIGTGKEILKWGYEDDRLQAVVLLTYVQNALLSHRVPASKVPITDKDAKAITGSSDLSSLRTDEMSGWGKQLLVPIAMTTSGSGDHAEIGIKFVPVPPDTSENEVLPGLAAVTYGTFSGGDTEPLGNDWEVGVEASGSLANRGVLFQPTSGDPKVEFLNIEPGSSASQDQFVMTATIGYTGGGESVKRDVVNAAVGRITVKSVDFEVTTEYKGGDFEFRVAANAKGELSVEARGGFLEKVIPEPITYEFDTTIGWSSKSGFFIQNGGTLEASIPTNIDLGVFKLGGTHIGVTPALSGGDGEEPGIPVKVSTSPTLDLGFLTANVNRIGVQLDLRFPEDRDGNLGAADIQVGFKPPNGIGLGINAGAVSGGGQLNFFPEENRYSGTLSLQVGNIGLTAVGLLKTELPGGQDGYSLLILITADLPPVQLGFGFVLTGVGGMLGINRQAKMDELGATVRTGSLSSVLFPQNVVENSQQIISDLRTIFPPRADRHVVGPMARLGWGTPVMLRMKIGVILEIPTWKIAIAGIFQLDLPDQKVALIDINLAVVGVIDIPNKRIAIDASLYDSRIVQFTVSGDMAMRLRWGDDSRFVLSIGGFHPRFEAPEKFPSLDRVKVEMSPPSGNPRMGMKGYLAVTPNTFQVGAKFFIHGEFGPATVDGKLGFDALFHFDPFKFVIDFIAKISVGIKGKGLSLKLDGRLKGPGPFHLDGKVTIDILFFETTVKVQATFGESKGKESLPAANVMKELTAELGKPANWSAQLPPGSASLVNVRQPESESEGEGGGSESDGGGDDSGPVLVHPLGGVSVRQTVVPLAFRIDLYGNAKPATYDRFEITNVSVDGSDLTRGRRVKEKFAPAKYREMSDAEKLESPAFVKRQAGIEAGSNLLYYPGREGGSSGEFADRTVTKLEYETSVIDKERDHYATPLPRLGSFAAKRREASRFGLPQEKLPTLIGQTAAGRAFRDRHELEDIRAEVYGVRGGTVIGTRDGPGDRVVDVDPGAGTRVRDPRTIPTVVDDGTVTGADLRADDDLVILGEVGSTGDISVDGDEDSAAGGQEGFSVAGEDGVIVAGDDGIAVTEMEDGGAREFRAAVGTDEVILSEGAGVTNFGTRTKQGDHT